jgi:hypothetical protein
MTFGTAKPATKLLDRQAAPATDGVNVSSGGRILHGANSSNFSNSNASEKFEILVTTKTPAAIRIRR